MSKLPDGVTDEDIERVLKAAHSEAEYRTRHTPALREVALDAATDGVLWALERYSAERGGFEAFAITVVRRFIWRNISASAAKYHNRPGVGELSEELCETLAAPDRCARDDGRDYRLPDAVRELPSDLRDAVRFFYIDGHNLRDCGLLLGCEMETVRRRLRHAAEALRDGQQDRTRKAGEKRVLR